MSKISCPRESALLRALRSADSLGAEDREHLEGCAACRLAAVAHAALAPLCRLPRPAHLPPAGAVLLRARLAARRQASERALAPIALWRLLIAVVATGGTCALFLFGPLSLGLGLRPASAQDAPLTVAALGLLGLAVLPFLRQLRALASER